ncbi:hypothetical protein [Shewanella glacialipiscicola]|uniref:hypothetical protein n=1 Tax=Shewanella glacialipiscicola TaxID=614069 RepID=UPI001BC2BEF6|nr:hypothetical protein [Shewanella glacialipiscicola]MCL1086414.1 hypothetical protein [Shewanella glacialipiscicola]MCU7995312.1 hypothetical protein [Shewanella glacialipiscicola]MCU8026655.1 hypothetical protein [Shewanella glacialipiscicola]GIU12580.1 hypothetical protein TUM4636_22640 [Shewanella glacialipiscicola]
MLIQRLLKKKQVRLAELTEQSRIQNEQLQVNSQLLAQHIRIFMGSTPGLMMSFGLGCLFQLRHNSTVKLVRSLFGLRWITKL